jgi:hypothetical protein
MASRRRHARGDCSKVASAKPGCGLLLRLTVGSEEKSRNSIVLDCEDAVIAFVASSSCCRRRQCAGSSPPGQSDRRLPLRSTADREEKSGLAGTLPVSWLGLRESRSLDRVPSRRMSRYARLLGVKLGLSVGW